MTDNHADRARRRAIRARMAATGENYTTAARAIRREHTSGPTPPPAGHEHDGFPIPDEPGAPFGVPGRLDLAPLGRLVGAGYDGCQPCQDAALDALATNAGAAARMAELAGMVMMDQLGGLPAGMYDDNAPGAPSHHAGLRAAIRAAMAAGEGEPDRPALYRVVAALTAAERRAMCDNAADTIIGVLSVGDI